MLTIQEHAKNNVLVLHFFIRCDVQMIFSLKNYLKCITI